MNTAQAETPHGFPCQQCGAQMFFQPGTNELACDHCGHSHRITLSREPINEFDYHSTVKHLIGSAPEKVATTIKCHACSAEFEFDKSIHADECPFCGSPIVVDATSHRLIQPKSLLPFFVSPGQATESYKKWLKRLWFAPNKLKKYAKTERKLKGVYAPYWTYDCNTQTRYRGERGEIYRVPQRVSVMVNGRRQMQTRMVTKIRWHPAKGSVRRSFDDTMVYATNSLPREMARELAPWDLGELTPYQDEFLSGFQSEVYKIDLDDGFEVAKERMHPVIRHDIRNDIGGDQQRIHASETRYSNISFKHILLPFWIAGFRFRNKTYQFVVNGRTGEVHGDRPYSWLKIALAGLLIGVALGLFGYLYSMTEGGGSFSLGDFFFQTNLY